MPQNLLVLPLIIVDTDCKWSWHVLTEYSLIGLSVLWMITHLADRRTFFMTSLVTFTVFQDDHANAELAKIMGEFTEAEEPVPSSSSKGDDLLAMMDGLWCAVNRYSASVKQPRLCMVCFSISNRELKEQPSPKTPTTRSWYVFVLVESIIVRHRPSCSGAAVVGDSLSLSSCCEVVTQCKFTPWWFHWTSHLFHQQMLFMDTDSIKKGENFSTSKKKIKIKLKWTQYEWDHNNCKTSGQ